jgi:beta-barrel assembly-enhancing protease
MNTFALPGGFIGVHSGLVLAAQSESELAAVMAHEIGHVAQRHIARMIAKQRDSGLIAIGALLLAILAARSGSSSSGQATEAAIAVGQAAAIQQQLNFSREAEREADRVGFQILNDAGFDVTAMASFFTRLQQGSRVYESAAPAYLRTHPLTVERIGDIQTRVRELRPHPHPDSLDFQLTRARLRVLQDESVQGLQDSLAYFNGQLKNRTTPSDAASYYGAALASLRLNQAAAALDFAQNARRQTRTASAMLDKLVSETRFAAAKTDAERAEAVRMAREATVRFPISRLTTMHYVDLLQRTGQHEQAASYLREQIALPRSDPQYFELLARSYAALDRKTQQHQATAEMYLLMGSLPAAIDQLQSARKFADADFYVMSEVDARLRQLTQTLREQREELAKSGRAPPPDDESKKR